MTSPQLLDGSQIACELPPASLIPPIPFERPKTLDDLLQIWEQEPPREVAVLNTTCSLLAGYLEDSVENISLDWVSEMREGFRAFLFGRRYKENSIRTYVNHLRILLKSAQQYGWQPSQQLPESWREVLERAVEQKCDALVRHLAKIRKSPADVTVEDVDCWVLEMGRQGRSHKEAKSRSSRFLRVLRGCGYELELPVRFFREQKYGISIKKFPAEMKIELEELLRWKQANFALDRPKGARLRPITAFNLQSHFEGLYGFALNILNVSSINNISDLIQKQVVGAFVEWSMNERKVKGNNLRRNLGLVRAALTQHPSHRTLDWDWLKQLIDSIPLAPQSEGRERTEQKYLDYSVIELIPALIRENRKKVEKKGIHRVAPLVTEELLMKWISILPWRQRNIRECRIHGSKPNLFKGPIPKLSQIQKPDWVKAIEEKDSEATFWQFRFGADETKTGIEVHALVPRQLVDLIEEYINTYRKHLIRGADPGTLLLNRRGKALSANNLEHMVARLTMRFGGRRVTPHAFRDIVAFTWLEQHPADYLTLSKMLWHSNINTTIQIYGSRFNESSGVRAMEGWLDERAAKAR